MQHHDNTGHAPQPGPWDSESLRSALREVRLGDFLKLTRTALGLSQLQLAELLNWEQSSVARAESGKRGSLYDIRTLLEVARKLDLPRELLGLVFSGDEALLSRESGRYPQQATLDEERVSVNRKQFLHGAMTMSLGLTASADYIRSGARGDVAATVDAIAGPIKHYRQIEQEVPASDLIPAVDAHLDLVRNIANRGGNGKQELYSLLAECAGFSAWLSLDGGDHGSARRRYIEAIRYGKLSGNLLLVSYMAASLAQFATETGNPRQGVALLVKATAYLDGSEPAAARAWTESIRAVALARIGEAKMARHALRQAELDVGVETSSAAWPWIFPFTESKMSRYQASALARIGDVRNATIAYEAARPEMMAPKPRALAMLDQARLFVSSGEPDRAAHYALEALRLGKDCRSERIISGVVEVRSSITRSSHDLGRLDRSIAALYEGQECDV